MNKKIGTVFMVVGILLVASAVVLFTCNRLEEAQAGRSADDAMVQILEQMPVDQPENNPVPNAPQTDATMSTLQIGDYRYIGYLSIPDLGIKLPVMDSWDYDKLKIAPCYYYGSYKTDDLVIAAHNYTSHFGGIKDLNVDSAVYFTDADGKIHAYKVVAIEILQPDDTLQMIQSEFDLSLYTCTYGGSERVTVRCERM